MTPLHLSSLIMLIRSPESVLKIRACAVLLQWLPWTESSRTISKLTRLLNNCCVVGCLLWGRNMREPCLKMFFSFRCVGSRFILARRLFFAEPHAFFFFSRCKYKTDHYFNESLQMGAYAAAAPPSLHLANIWKKLLERCFHFGSVFTLQNTFLSIFCQMQLLR